MTVQHVGAYYITCLSGDTKPTGLPVNFIAFETDTNVAYVWNGTTWNVLTRTFDSYFDIKDIAAPSNPASNYGRVYLKSIDSNNDGLFMVMKKAGSFVEVQIG